MSGASEDKLDPGKALPLDLAAKLTSVKTVDVKTPLIMAGQQTIRGMRVLTTTPGQGGAVTGSTIIMPSQVLKAAGHQIAGIINASQGGGNTLPANITIQRPAQITLATSLPVMTAQASPQGGATYHVPRGPAVVATLSAPRSSNVGPIRNPLVVRDGSVIPASSLTLGGVQSSNPGGTANMAGVQQFSVRPTRTPSPAVSATAAATAAWLTTVTPNAGNGSIQQQQGGYGQQQHGGKGAGVQQQQQQLLTPIRSTQTQSSFSNMSLSNASMHPAASMSPSAQVVTPKGGATAAVVPAGLIVTRTQPGQQSIGGQPQAINTTLATIRPTIYQPGANLPINNPLHSFKSGSQSGGQQSGGNISSSVSIAQVLPNRTQTLVYSGGGPMAPNQQTSHSFTNAPRLAISTPSVPFRQTPTPRSMVTATRLTMPVGALTAQAGARVLTAPPGTTVLTSSGVRISSVSTISHQGHQQQQPVTTLGGSSLATRGISHTSATTTTSLASVTAIGHVTSLPTSLGGGATLTPAPPVAMGGPGGRLSTVTVAPGSTATLSLTNNAHGHQIISAGGGGQGVRSHTVNLHTLPLVAVTNTPPHHSLGGPGGGGSIGSSGGPKGLIHQSGAIHLTPMSSAIKSAQNIAGSAIRTNANLKPAQRHASVVTTQAIPIGKVYPQQGELGLAQPNVYIHTSVPSAPKRASPGLLSISDMTAPAITYSIMGNPVLHTGGPGGAATLPQLQLPTPFTMSQVSIAPNVRPAIYTSHNQQLHATSALSQQQQPSKLTSSPRPSILRKRDNEGSPLKAAKNLSNTLNSMQQQQQQVQHILQQQHHQQMQQQQQMPLESPRSPHIRPDSRNNGNSSEGGSTTISASSSPGLGDTNDDMVSISMNIVKGEEENQPPPEMSPRKKPRKQILTGNDCDENRHDDMQFLNDVKKELPSHQQQQTQMDHSQTHDQTPFNNSQQQHLFNQTSTIKQEPQESNQSQQQRSGGKIENKITRKPQASLLNSYRQTWKTTNNHYLRYSDVKPKDERRPSIMDLSNQYRVLDKVNGWKIHHLSTQMEDLADQEQAVYNQLTELLKYTESREWNSYDKDVNRINELIKGNLQRIKIINDGMMEAKAQIMKIFDHKTHVIDIISRCASKRNYKKREKV